MVPAENTMNIQGSHAAISIAGTSIAAAKGGESDKQGSESASQLATSGRPAGRDAATPEVDPGEHLGDRGGDGRQLYDTFEHREERDPTPSDEDPEEHSHSDGPASASDPATCSHLDLEI